MNRSVLNLVLGLVLLALGVAVFFSQKKEEKGAPLTALTAETISKAAIEHPDAAAIRLEKQDGVWKLTAPVQVEADKFEINNLLSLATLEQKKTLKPADVKLADLGLDPPAYSVTLNDTRLELGGVEPIQYQRYIKVADSIALTDDPPGAALDKDYSDLVSKSLLPEGAELVRIELPGLTVAKNEAGQWSLLPADPNAGADQIQKLVDGWKNARALWNELDQKKDAKGDPVTLTLQDGGVRRFVVTQREPQLQLARPELGVRYNLSKVLVDELLKLPSPPPKEEPKVDTAPLDPAADALAVPPAK